MILYLKCICKTNDRLLKAKYEAMGAEIRVTRNSAQWSKRAKTYKTPLPFVVNGHKATAL